MVSARGRATTGGPPPPPPDRGGPITDRPPPPDRPVWNSSGWTMIGERTVDGRADQDVIDVQNAGVDAQSRFTKLTVVVLDSDLEMVEMKLFFRSGQSYPTDIKNVAFREGSRTRVINLPSELLTRVTFRYRNLPGGGRARVQLWGGTAGGAGASVTPPPVVNPPPTAGNPPPPPPVSGGPAGWTQLAERPAATRSGETTIDVTSAPKKIQLAVVDGDVEIVEMKVFTKAGKNWVTDVKGVMKAGTRSKEINTASEQLTRVTIKFKNSSGGSPKLQLFAGA